MIPKPEDESILHLGHLYLEEDSPEIHQAFQALTRLVSPSISLVCLQRKGGKLFTLDDKYLDSLEEIPESPYLESINRSIISVSNWKVINHFRGSMEKQDDWQKNPVLRNCYPAIFENGVCQLDEKLKLVLDKEIGMQFLEEK